MAISQSADFLVGQLARHLFLSVILTLSLATALSIAVLLYLDVRVDSIGAAILGVRALLSLGFVSVTALLIKKLQEANSALSKARDDALAASRRDPLTGLLNHGAIVSDVEQLLSSPGTYAIFMTDVDDLKAINDRYGHKTGDEVLMSVAACLSQEDALVGRYGGDEFVSVLKCIGRQSAERYREKVMSALDDSRIFDQTTGNPVSNRVSIGIAMFPAEAKAVEGLMRLSDEAMYAIKRQRPISRASHNANRPSG